MKKISLARVLSALPLVALAHCAPMTFSKDTDIDFDVYRSVRVEVTSSGDYSSYADSYLVDRLARTSGFTTVTLDPDMVTDLVLQVDVAVSEEINVDNEGNLDIDYQGSALFRAITPDGTVVDSGDVEDTSEFEHEAVEDVLDEIEYRYMDAYRY